MSNWFCRKNSYLADDADEQSQAWMQVLKSTQGDNVAAYKCDIFDKNCLYYAPMQFLFFPEQLFDFYAPEVYIITRFDGSYNHKE